MPDRYQPLRDAIAAGPMKGPWLRSGRTVYANMFDSWRKGVEQMRNRFTVSVQHDRECSDREAYATAALIAAADPDTIAALLEERDHLHEECHEQARLLGISGSIEAKLLTERDALKSEIERLQDFLRNCSYVYTSGAAWHLPYLCDTIDNDGQPYQSQALADYIAAMEANNAG